MKISKHTTILLLLLNFIYTQLASQEIPEYEVIKINELANYLKVDKRSELAVDGKINTTQLADYFKTHFSNSFYYDHRSFDDRLMTYNKMYANQSNHKNRALDHLNKYPDSTQWVLPFNYQNGKPVNAYALRHLARQHKMVDIALHYFNDNKDPKYITYFENQMQSLNAALEAGQYDKIENGNGVYEVYRAGYRAFNWLWIHNMFLGEAEYGPEDQLKTIATLLQHGQHLYTRNQSFRPGNHQTKGMSALAVLAILFRDFEGTDKWLDRAMTRLSEHLDKEINDDGFQFERSVHYHMSDIGNYFFVYQLAKINKIQVDKKWEAKLRSLFITLTKIAFPDKSAPVLQDDTRIPWGEKNDISGTMTLGYLLFENPEFGYFATDKVSRRMYWYLSNEQVKQLTNIEQKVPNYGSVAFEDTHYYIMREGWVPDDKMMVISAGLDMEKPDHQHGDMLGIQAIANGQIILPNYQVRYSLPDFDFFKNSMVKNVALVDNELQGKQWTSNKGGSGFGKFKELPNPNVIAWESNDAFDFFVGSHDGFENVGVDYARQVIYIKDDFWIVKDNFQSKTSHEYKQVWQGHYTDELGPNLIRSSFSDAAGCDILQLNEVDKSVTSGTRGKNWTVISKNNQQQFNFLTAIFPYQNYNNRINETAEQISLNGWVVNDDLWTIKGSKPTSLSKEKEAYLFDIIEVKLDKFTIEVSVETDLYLSFNDNTLTVYNLGTIESEVTITNDSATTKLLQPGQFFSVKF